MGNNEEPLPDLADELRTDLARAVTPDTLARVRVFLAAREMIGPIVEAVDAVGDSRIVGEIMIKESVALPPGWAVALGADGKLVFSIRPDGSAAESTLAKIAAQFEGRA